MDAGVVVLLIEQAAMLMQVNSRIYRAKGEVGNFCNLNGPPNLEDVLGR